MANNSRDETLNLIFATQGDKGLLDTATALDTVAKSGSDLAPQAQALLDQLAKLGEQSAAVTALQSLNAQLEANASKLADAKQRVSDYTAQIAAGGAATQTQTAALAAAEKAVTTLGNAQGVLTDKVNAATQVAKAQGVDVTNLGAAHTALGQKITGVTGQMDALAKQAGVTSDAHKKLSEQHTETGLTAEQLKEKFHELIGELFGLDAAIELVKKGFEFGSETLKGAEAVEASLSRVQALAKGAQVQFAELDEAVEKAAQAVNVTGEVAATQLAALAQSGLTANDAIAALVPTLQLAKIAQVDAATAANDVALALKSFNLPATDAQHVVDLLTAASHGAAGGLAEISKAAVTLAPDAHALGLSFDQVVGIIGLLADKGVEGRKSLEGMRTIFQELQNPTSALRVDLLGLGDGSNSFNAAIKALTSGTPQATAALQRLTGATRTVIESLGQSGPEGIAKFTAALEAQQGIAATVAKELDDNLRGAYTRFSNSITAVSETLAKPILKPFAEELNKLAEQLRAFSETDDFKKIEADVVTMVEAVVKAIDEFVQKFDSKTFLADAKGILSDITDAFGKLGTAASAVTTVVNTALDAVGVAFHGVAVVIDETEAVLAKGLGVVVSGLAALDRASKELSGTNTETETSLEQLADSLNDIAEHATENLNSHLKSLEGAAGDLQKQLTPTTDAVKASGDAAEKSAGQHEKNSAAIVDATHSTEQLAVITKAATPAYVDFATQLANTNQKLIENKAAAANAGQGADALKTAFTALRISSQNDLEQAALTAKSSFDLIDKSSAQTAEGLADRKSAFAAYAAAALTAAKNLESAAQLEVESQLAITAAGLGSTKQLEAMEKAILGVTAAFEGERSGGVNITKMWNEQQDAIKKANEALFNMTDLAGKSASDIEDIGKAAGKSVDEINDMKDALEGVTNELEKADRAARNLDASVSLGVTGVSELGAALFKSLDQATLTQAGNQILAAKEKVVELTAAFTAMGDGSASAFERQYGSVQVAQVQLARLTEQLKAGTSDLSVLDAQSLSGLQSALAAATAKVQALTDAAKAAKDQFDSLAQSAQDALDQANGNDTAIEDRRFQKQIDDLKAAASASNQLNSAAYQQAVQNAAALHDLNLKNIKAEADARNSKDGTPNSSSSGGSSSSGSGSSSSGGSSGSSGSGSAGAATGGITTVNLNVNGSALNNVNLNDPAIQKRIGEIAVNEVVKAAQLAGSGFGGIRR